MQSFEIKIKFKCICFCRSNASSIFVGAGRGHVLLKQYFQNACYFSIFGNLAYDLKVF